MELNLNGKIVRMFSTVTTLATANDVTANDVTLQELHVESVHRPMPRPKPYFEVSGDGRRSIGLATSFCYRVFCGCCHRIILP